MTSLPAALTALRRGDPPPEGGLFEAAGGVADDGRTLLMHAARLGSVAWTHALLCARGADGSIDARRSRDGCTALHYASFTGFGDVVGELLAHGARSTLENRFGESPAASAAASGYAELSQWLANWAMYCAPPSTSSSHSSSSSVSSWAPPTLCCVRSASSQ